jgi:hypothetical protein
MNRISSHLDADMHAHARPSNETWSTEEESAREFDERIAECGLFERVFTEVRGFYLAHRPGRRQQDARIDRILIPGARLRELGWMMTIGVEIKKSGCDFGGAVSQAIDYTYCNWNIGSYWMYCERIFLWPFAMPLGPLQAVMLQNGVGTVGGRQYRSMPGDSLIFSLEKQVIVVDDKNQLTACSPTTSGKKMGSR